MLFDSEKHYEISRYLRTFDFGWFEAMKLARGSIEASKDMLEFNNDLNNAFEDFKNALLKCAQDN